MPEQDALEHGTPEHGTPEHGTAEHGMREHGEWAVRNSLSYRR